MTEFLDACYAAIRKQETSIANTLAAVNTQDATILHDKRLIVLTGCGDSLAAADYGKWAFLRQGLNAITLSPSELTQVNLDKDCVVIGVSASGRSLATIDALNLAQEARATTVVLTDKEDGDATEYADYTWTTKSGVSSYNISPSSITTTAMAYFLKLSAEYQESQQTKISGDVDQLRKSGKRIVGWAEESGKQIAEVPILGRPLFMIAEGANYAAAQVGMMKFNEYGVLQSAASLREDFRHHNVLTINKDDGAVLITDSPTKEDDRRYMQALLDTLKMRSYHLFTPEEIGLQTSLGQAISNSIALQMAAYYNVLKHDSHKEGWRKPNVDAFKIY
ncbi:SIS domain-containing protein [Candidatus Thorarchaeota archaeon]|nr:MAG: SIS domain-containing protein [Candidatus Thorarchaeota archaeon]